MTASRWRSGLAADGIEPFLVSEAVRGEGAYLRSTSGERFMTAIHPMAELAPRDVVARAIQAQLSNANTGRVYLDLRHLDGELVRRRFPSISERLESHGIDLGKDLIPVAPAAHYFMGGIVAGTNGRTSMPGLLAIGEVSCTGVHGATGSPATPSSKGWCLACVPPISRRCPSTASPATPLTGNLSWNPRRTLQGNSHECRVLPHHVPAILTPSGPRCRRR